VENAPTVNGACHHTAKVAEDGYSVTGSTVPRPNTFLLLLLKLEQKKLITHHFTLDKILDAYSAFGNAVKESTLKVIISNN
jgi:hypothetical protein